MSEKRPSPRQSDRDDGVRLAQSGLQGNADQRLCAREGCFLAGEFKAPADRHELRTYIWLCLEHVREYNARWNYFEGMSEPEIERHVREDTTWHRPTWQFGTSGNKAEREFVDPFHFFGEDRQPSSPPMPKEDARTRDMMQVLELSSGFSEDQLKSQYKVMAKRHHPDLNGGDRNAEEMLKRVNEAYAHLRQQFA